MAEEHPDFETFELDDTNRILKPIGSILAEAIRDEYDVSDDANIYVYTIDADVSENVDSPGKDGKFTVGAMVVNK